jgi:hypothetical protein
MIVVWIDPPSGWKYGFPKSMPKEQYDANPNITQWLLDNGYPQKEIDACGKYMYTQNWEEEI